MTHAAAGSRLEPIAAKVPEVTFLFWVIKLLTTAGGEAVSDYLALKGYTLAGVVEVAIFVVAVAIQFSTRRYIAGAYWFLALAIAIFGTGAADFMHLILKIPYGGTTAFWAVVLAAVFWLWYRSERTLSIHSIVTTRREVYYWATVYATFALGTALGDFTAQVLHFGYLGSIVLFAIVIMIPAVAWSRFGLNSVLCFWFAYVVTRPLGASFADWFSKPQYLSGLNYGDGPVAVVLLLMIAAFVVYTAIARYDIQQPATVGGLPGDGEPARTPGPRYPKLRQLATAAGRHGRPATKSLTGHPPDLGSSSAPPGAGPSYRATGPGGLGKGAGACCSNRPRVDGNVTRGGSVVTVWR